MKYESGGIVTSGHNLIGAVGFEDLWRCTRCNCAEGTLPTSCPGVRVPYRVQDLIFKGVVDFVGDRWVGLRKPPTLAIRLTSATEAAALAFRQLAQSFASAGKAMADFLPRSSREVAFGRLMLITGRDRVTCGDPRVIRYKRADER